MTLSIKFCGGCNSKINRGRIADEIRNYFIKEGIRVITNDLDADFILYISGCAANCAESNTMTTRMAVVIAGSSVNAIAIDENCLSSTAIMKITESLEKNQG